jgi:metacaspase-1
MKYLKAFFLYLLLLFSVVHSLNITAQEKYALLIAIGDYPEEGKWTKISSVNDTSLILDALRRQKFDEENISMIIDELATKTGILDAFEDLSSRVDTNDIVFIHFSGHGQQIEDDNADEFDGYDEALIPYDAFLFYEEGVYEGENHFRDDELGKILSDLQYKLGEKGNILVVLDACHSGTGTRGLTKARGSGAKFKSKNFSGKGSGKKSQNEFFESKRAGTQGSPASLVILSGASADQLNYEYRDRQGNSYGSLSYAFYRAIFSAGKGSTYRGLFESIKLTMSKIAPYQFPQAEGDIDQEIFGGKSVIQKPYFLVDELINMKLARISAGTLSDLTNGTKVGIYNESILDPAEVAPFAVGIVQNAQLLSCEIVPSIPLNKALIEHSRIFIEEPAISEMRKSVDLSSLNPKSDLFILLKQEIEKAPTLELAVEEADLFVELNRKQMSIFTEEDQLVGEFTIERETVYQVSQNAVRRMKALLRSDMLRELEMQDTAIRVILELIPVSIKKENGRYVEASRIDITEKTERGQLTFRDGDVFKIRVKNLGASSAFFQIIDIKPNNEIDLLVPSGRETAAEYKIAGNTTRELPNLFIFEEHPGNEMFKLIATREPLDLNSIITTRGGGKSGNFSLLEQIMQDAFIQTRTGPVNAPPSTANISSIVLNVKKEVDNE